MSQETGISGSLRHYNCDDECKEVGHLIEVNYHFRLLSKMKLKIMIPTHENWGSVQATPQKVQKRSFTLQSFSRKRGRHGNHVVSLTEFS